MRNIVDASKLDLKSTIVNIRRVAKTVKGGRNMRFSVTVVVGDGNGYVGVGLGKSQEIPEAVRKAEEDAKKDKELEKLKHDILVRDCKDSAVKNLSTAGLPVELADVLDYTSEETVEKSLGVVKDVFVACLEKGIKERLKGKTPVGLNANKDITEIGDRKARMQKIMGINKK